MSGRLLRTLALVAVAWLVAQAASACPVCFEAEGEARIAYQVTAAGMTLLPLFMMGGAAFWLRRRIKQRALDVHPPDLG